MKFQGKSSLWMESLRLACCQNMSSTSCSGKLDSSLTNLQDDDVGSIMTEELTSSNRSKGQQQEETFSFLGWRSAKTTSGLDRVGSGISVVSASGGDTDGGGGEELTRYFMFDQGKLASSQYKGVVPQPNGRWGAQIYERHQRVWLGTFNREEDAARAYDRAVLKFRGRDAITNFRAVADVDPEARFMSHHSKDEIVHMLRKHTYDEELDRHTNNKKNTAINSDDRQGNEGATGPGPTHRTANSSSQLDNPAHDFPCPPREHLFDKAVTLSDVGKLNRLVIPKQHAEKYFPLDVISSDKRLLLNFEDNMGKAWQFRYSYWNSSQSYVLTKGWSRFVKDKKLEAGDIVSFHRGSPEPHQLYITWKHRPCSKLPVQTKANVSFPYGAYNPQWTHIFWPNSELVQSHADAALWPPQSPAIPLYLSAPAMCLNIKYRPNEVEATAEKEAPSSFDPGRRMKEVRLFGVNLAESYIGRAS